MKKIVFLFVAIALLAITSCQDKAVLAELDDLKAQIKLEEQNKVLAEKWHQDITLNLNWEVADEILAADFVVHYDAPGQEDVKGIEGVKNFAPMWKSLTNLKITNHEIIAEGDYVLIRWEASFDHTVEVMGVPASGNHIGSIFGMDLFLIKDGKITDLWQSWDQLSFMQQMGAFPKE